MKHPNFLTRLCLLVLAMTLALLVWLALCVVASRRYYQADAKQRESG